MTYKETFAWKAVSVATAIATIVTLSGVVYLTQVFNVYAAGEEAVVEDVTGTSPRIAANGESERVALGINVVGPETQTTLTDVNVHLTSDDAAAEAAVSNIETVRVYRDSSLSGTNGVFDSSDALIASVTRTVTSAATDTLAAAAAVADNCVTLGDITGFTNGDTVKLGSGTESEILVASQFGGADPTTCQGGYTWGANSVLLAAGLGSAKSSGAPVREVAAIGTDDAFTAYTTESLVNITTSFLIPKDDAGNNAGNDLFVVLVTADGEADQTVKAQVFTSDLTEGGSNAITVSSASGTTDGTTKAITFGGDGVAPTITKVETHDNSANGTVDRIKVYFSESMAAGVTSTRHFVKALGNADGSTIEAGTVDIELNSTGTWSTTTVLNDTLTINFANPTAYSDRVNSTGDKWTVIYDQENAADGSATAANRLVDATGEEMLDQSVVTTDMAKPYPVSAKLVDANGNNKVDSLEVTFSETLGSATTSAGFTLKEGSNEYTLGAVTGFKKSSGTNANANDTVVIAVTEHSSNDVTKTFTLNYAASGGVVDVAGNSAVARTGISPISVSAVPVPTKAEYKDTAAGSGTANNGQIDTLEITFSRNISGTATLGWTVNGYAIASGAIAGNVLTLHLTESGASDTGKTPDVTYSKSVGDLILSGGTSPDDDVQNVSSGDLVEADKAAPVLLSATLYENTANDIWETGESLQLFFSEPVDPATIASSWNESGADGSVWVDWRLESSSGVAAVDGMVPDSGTISVNGRVVTLTASENAGTALTTTERMMGVANEVKDPAGNSMYPTTWANGVALVVTPTTAPNLVDVQTRDMNGNGILDALVVQFDGMIDASTIVAGDFAAVREASYSTTTESSPDLTITSVATESGGNDTTVIVRFNEQNENTGALPKLKYVQGTLADLAGNLVPSFNEGTDTAKFSTSISGASATVDGAAPQVVLKRLKDRNNNGLYDQLVLVFSEAMATGTDTDGWKVDGEVLAQTGTWSANNMGTYDAYTFANTANVFKIDILETDAPTVVPGVSYASTGAFKDVGGNALPLASVSAGGEESEINVMAPAAFNDGDLVREAGSFDVYIVSHPGTKKFKRLILNPDIFNSYGHLSWAAVQDVPAGTLNAYTASELIMEVNPDGSAVNGMVYNVSSTPGADDGTKRHLNMSASMFESCGYDWDAIAKVNHVEASESFYVTGAVITSC